MLGSAGQNIIALTDSLFLYHYNEHDFAAIGIVSVFYLIISSIAYGFSKGGQIVIARKYGERSPEVVKKYFYTLCVFELILGVLIFSSLKFFPREILSSFIHSEIILEKSLEFIHYRIYGLIFTYLGLGFFGLYMGLSKSRIIFINTIFLGICNLSLCYIFVFGKFGFDRMGIAGAGLASSVAEILAFTFFLIYLVTDKQLRFLNIFSIPNFNIGHIRTLISISMPILIQTIISIVSWFLFFVFIEKLGERALSISNLLRIIYLVFTIPCWGFALSLNTIISKTIGRRKEKRVIKQIMHGSYLSVMVTGVIAFPFLFFPMTLLGPILGNSSNQIFLDSLPYFPLLYFILIVTSYAIIFFNGVSGTGETLKSLNIQIISSIIYLLIAYISIMNPQSFGLYFAWFAELAYWSVQGTLSWIVLKSGKWLSLKI